MKESHSYLNLFVERTRPSFIMISQREVDRSTSTKPMNQICTSNNTTKNGYERVKHVTYRHGLFPRAR